MSNGKFRKVLAIALAASLAVASLPMTALPVYAEEAENGVTKSEVTAANVNDYIEMDSSNLQLSYNQNDQFWKLYDAISVKEQFYDVMFRDIWLKKVDSNGVETGDYITNLKDVGTYNIYVTIGGEEYYSEGPVSIGKTVTIGLGKDSCTYNEQVYYPWRYQTDESEDIYLGLDIKYWLEGNSADTVDATVRVDDAGTTYIKDYKYDKATQQFQFTFTDAAKQIDDEKHFITYVEFTEGSFNNYSKVSIIIPMIISPKQQAGINFSDEDDNYEKVYPYSGEAIEPQYKVRKWNMSTGKWEDMPEAVTPGALTIKIYKNETEVAEIKDAGYYEIKAEYEDETFYGADYMGITITPKKITTQEELQSLLSLKSNTLQYTGDWQLANFKKLVTHVDDLEDEDIFYRFDYEDGTNDNDLKKVGTYSVYVSLYGNYRTEQPIKLGEITIVNGPTSSGGGVISSGGSASESNTTTETKPDGTTVESSTETKTDGTKVETTTETKTDGTKVETVVETTKDGSVKTTETVTQADGSATKTEKENGTNAMGKEVAVTTTTKTDATGVVTSVTEKSTIASSATTNTTVTVKKDGEGAITSATASIAKTVSSGNKATVSASVVSQILEAAGTGDVKVTMTVKDSEGKTKYKVKVDAENLQAGEELYIYKLDTKTGEYVMVNAKAYEVTEAGSVSVSVSKKATYELVSADEAAAINKQIKSNIKPKKSSASVKPGKSTSFSLSSKANEDNIKSVTYTTSNKSVVTVNKDGKISAKGKGTVTVKATVTLKNGETKTIKMTIKVK